MERGKVCIYQLCIKGMEVAARVCKFLEDNGIGAVLRRGM